MSSNAEKLVVRIDADAITLVRYPFLSRNQGRTVLAKTVSDLVVGWAPPCFRTHDGEYLFVPADQLEALACWGEDNQVAFKSRVDVWSMILDPFLDTELDEAYLSRSRRTLAANGISEEEVSEMRRLVGTRMRLLTYQTWEWAYFGLFDVLEQMLPLTFTTGWAFDRFYDHALELADRGNATIATADEMRRSFL